LSDTDSDSDSDIFTSLPVPQVEGGKRRSVTTASLVDAQPLVNKFKGQIAMKKKGFFQRLSKILSTDSMDRPLEYIDLNRFVWICMKEKIHLSSEELTTLFSFFDPMMSGLVQLDRMMQELYVDDRVLSEGGDIDAFRSRISQNLIASGIETKVTVVSPNLDDQITCSSGKNDNIADETINGDQKFKEMKVSSILLSNL
jgi:Ca2+-binding EF-hand superfamily protein